MFDFLLGIIIGAAFAPFWMKIWETCKAKYTEYKSKK